MKALSHKIVYLLIVSLTGLNLTAATAELLPLDLPWDYGGMTLNGVPYTYGYDKPAGKQGFIHIQNGHFYDGAGKRIRLLGVNDSFSGNYPTHEQAEKVAARMAKFGINSVRFHHTDTQRAPRGIWKADTPDKQTLDPENLDRLDYFFAQLKKHGIYANFNLKIGREVVNADGFTDTDRLPSYDKGPDHYFPRMIELQKNYARDLLTHRNPYTGNRYVDDPALAIIEINNESGLIHEWTRNKLDDLPEAYLAPLQSEWNAFLKKKYQSTGTLEKAWSPGVTGSGRDLLENGLNGWVLQQIGEGKGTKEIVPEGPNGEDALKLTATALGVESWHVQAHYRPLQVEQGGFYRFSFRVKSDKYRELSAGLKMDHDPWLSLDDAQSFFVNQRWREYAFSFSPSQDDSPARLGLSGLGSMPGTIWIANPKLIESQPEGLPTGQSLDDGNVAWVPRSEYGERSQPVKRDWMEFLVERESAYYRDMAHYIKNDLGAKSMIAGTQLDYGAITSQMENDFIDNHAYFHHPGFPGQPWDAENWTVENVSIVQESGNALEQLMLERVEGRPYTVSEYNHPAPNTYSTECIPLIAAYGAFQDWDGIFIYSYSHDNNYQEKSLDNFFDIYGHSPKMITFPASAHLFVRGDIATARETVSAVMTPKRYLDLLTEQNGNTSLVPLEYLGANGTEPYKHRTAIRFEEGTGSESIPRVQPSKMNMTADSGELIWNQVPSENAHVVIRSERTKGLIGFIREGEYDLGHDVSLEVGETIQGWATILLTYMAASEKGNSWLLTATGYHENTGMIWKDETKTSVGRNWGSGPARAEPIPLRLTFKKPETGESSTYINPTGARLTELDNRTNGKQTTLDNNITIKNNCLVIDLMDNPPSLWYELRFPNDLKVKNGERF